MSNIPHILLKCIVVDDEFMGRKLIEDYIDQHPNLTLTGSFRNVNEATSVLHSQEVDMMFLDIQMPGMLGTQFLKTLSDPPLTIFVSAYQQYAAEGFELNVVDYLVKPVGYERFSLAISKALKFAKIHNQETITPSLEKVFDHIFVYSEYALIKIIIKDITYIEGMKDYVKIYLDNEDKRVITKSSMKAIEAKIAGDSFFRIHKSYLINISKIKSIRNSMVLINDQELPISKTKLNLLLEQLNT